MNNDTAQPTEATTTDNEPATAPVTATGQLAIKDTAGDVIEQLVHDLHNLILITISAVYYLDCFAVLLLLRFVGQNQLRKGGIQLLLTTNLLCVATHILHSLPQPEPREYWNHGGALVDFVGEKPTTKGKVLLLDCVIVALQMLYLALHYKKGTVDDGKTAQAGQDLEAEEAGVLRADAVVIETEDGVELQPMLGDESAGESSGKAREQKDNTVLLRRRDWGQVFVSTTPTTETDESTAVLRRFLDRLNAIRARRDALAAQNAGTAAS